MKVRIVENRNLAGYGLIEKGQEIDLPDDVAAQLIQQDFAVVIVAKPKGAARAAKED